MQLGFKIFDECDLVLTFFSVRLLFSQSRKMGYKGKKVKNNLQVKQVTVIC